MEKTNKVVKGYSVDLSNAQWATQTAAHLTAKTGDDVSASKVVNAALAIIIEDEAHVRKLLAKVRVKTK